ncbi:MAG: hypothetical protein P8Y68_20100 [Anaerolineales bacterium]
MTATLTETIIAASVTVLSNGLGGLPFVFTKKFPKELARLGWAASGGLMLSASFFNLINPGLEDGGLIPVAIGITLGAILMVVTSMWLDNREIGFIHNIPEGLAVALPLNAEGVSGWRCVGWAIFSGVPQVIAAIPAYLAVIAFRPILPYAFGFAAGAMLLLVMSEMIPESRASESQRLSSAVAGMTGFLFMMVFQIIFS